MLNLFSIPFAPLAQANGGKMNLDIGTLEVRV